MKFSSIFSTIAIVGLVATGASFANANPNMNHNGSYMNHNVSTSEAKQLSAKDQKKLRTMQEDNYDKMRPMRNELRSKHLELNALSPNPNTSPEKISQLTGEISSLRNKMQDNNIEFSKKLESKFGPEYATHNNHQGNRHGNRGGHNSYKNNRHNGNQANNDFGKEHRNGMKGGGCYR